jgi:hypothetical protein
MAFYDILLYSIALSAIVASVLTKFKRVSRNRDNRETTESLKRDRKADLGHKIGLGELNYWRECCQMLRTF